MELTTGLPCTHFRPASMISHFELSIITGTLAISGSVAARLRKRTIAASLSSMPSSILMSIICAPFPTCWRAISSAVSKSPSVISLRNLAEPVTLVRSPTLMKGISSVLVKGSNPDRRMSGAASGMARGLSFAAAVAIASICSGVVPQQPPRILTNPASANSPTITAISSASWSYSPNSLGRPAFG